MSLANPKNLQLLKDQLERHYAGAHAKMREKKDLIALKHDAFVDLPEGIRVHKSSTPSRLVSVVAEQINVDQPRVEFIGAGSSKKANQHKDRMEVLGRHFLRGIVQDSVVDPFAQMRDNMTGLGAGVIKYVVDVTRLPDPPSERKDLAAWRVERASVWPFEVRALDPLNVMPAPGNHRKLPFVLERQMRLASELWWEYPHWTDPKKPTQQDDPTREVQWLEFWSADVYKDGVLQERGRYIVEADGDRIIDKVNPYGFPPYEFSYSGFGTVGDVSDPANLAISVLDDIVGELEEEIRLKTALSAQVQYYTFPPLLTPEDATTTRRKFANLGPGLIVRVQDMRDSKPEFMKMPPPSEVVLRFLAEVKENIFQKVPVALMQRPTGVDAAIHQALLMSPAQKLVRPLVSNLEASASALLNGMAKQLARLDLDVNLTGTTETHEKMMKASDIAQFNFVVSFEAADPTENDRRLLVGLSMLRPVAGGRPALSRRTFYERWGKGIVESPEEEEERIWIEEAVAQYVQLGGLMQVIPQEVAALEAEAAEKPIAEGLQERARQAVQGRPPPGSRERGIEPTTGTSLTPQREAAQQELTRGGV